MSSDFIISIGACKALFPSSGQSLRQFWEDTHIDSVGDAWLLYNFQYPVIYHVTKLKNAFAYMNLLI